ncbi:MAG: endo-1,4-beta-xylanase [Alistipes sp.]|jgi:endo-1,4-beta-xylanase|nr:endo-1,4-beta-xylanase [Alistipes sp.]
MKKSLHVSAAGFAAFAALTVAACGTGTGAGRGEAPALKESLTGRFHIGTALSADHIHERDALADAIIVRHFDAIVPENCMKSGPMQPREGEFFWNDADRFVEYGEKHGMWITGHCLVWHSQAPSWFFTDADGNDVSREVLIERMRSHIHAVVGRYKGRVRGWDVVNEAIMEDGSYRQSRFVRIIGEDFIPLAFQFAHEADPDAELYYNDYNEWFPGKRDAIVKLVGELKARGLRIDGVGMQGHVGMNSPTVDEYRAAIDAYGKAGVKVMITELDMSALPSPTRRGGAGGANIADTVGYREAMNPFTSAISNEVSEQWNARMGELFRLFLERDDVVSRVTLWGVTDATSWKNDFPMPGRTDYPLLFDRQYGAKPVVWDIANMAGEIK